MERTSKSVTETPTDPDPDAGDEPVLRPSLSDFLAVGLRESQRPPSMRPSQAPPEEAPPSPSMPAESSSLPAAPAHGAADGAAAVPASSAAEEEAALPAAAFLDGPGVDAQSDADSFEEPTEFDGDAAPVPVDRSRRDSDFVVPVPLFARPRVIAGVLAAALLIVALVFFLTRSGKAPPPLPILERTSVPAANEPLPPPPPPAEPVEPSAEMDEAMSDVPKITGGPGAPPTESSAAPPFGPNVARYPDLPTPVLIELEKAQQESKKSK